MFETLRMTLDPSKNEHETVLLEEEMRRSYLDYAMSVIVSRALPDARDGLKPVQRRILYAMSEEKCTSDRPHRKSARIVGDVLGKYHPHTDSSIYEAMARMAQDFSMRAPLVDGQGNFGSMDGDKAAASRYTEVRLTAIAQTMLEDYDKDVVDFLPNYDNTLRIPAVLPVKFPNLLVNGSGGIAVGMATNIPPHNLGEIIDACFALIDDPYVPDDVLFRIVPGPDFPTGGLVFGAKGIRQAYETGRGACMMRGRYTVETFKKDRHALVFTDVPYQVNKSQLLEKISELVDDKQIDGISEIRDESNYKGVRIVIELKRDTTPDVVANCLYATTPLQSSFSLNMLALQSGRPVQMGLRDLLMAFLDFREEVVRRRCQFQLRKARERYHVAMGLLIAVVNIDRIVPKIRNAKNPEEARNALGEEIWNTDALGLVHTPPQGDALSAGSTPDAYHLSDTQSRAILDLRLHRLTSLETNGLVKELETLALDIQACLDLLGSRALRMETVRTELQEVRARFATPRKSDMVDAVMTSNEEDFVQREEMVVTVTVRGYIKRVPLSTYRAQRRGGRGKTAMETREEDTVEQVFSANTHTPLLFFSSGGTAFQLRVYDLPLGSPNSRGKPMVGVLPLETGETLATLLPLPEDKTLWTDQNVVFVTAKGNVRRNALADFDNIRANGKIAMKLEEEGEALISVKLCHPEQDVLLTTRLGKAIRFSVQDVRQFVGRTSTGVRGMHLSENDAVVSMLVLDGAEFSIEERAAYLKDSDVDAVSLSKERAQAMHDQEQWILAVSSSGFGKRTSAYAYRRSKRGGQGVTAMDLTKKTGAVVASFVVCDADQVLFLTSHGRVLRCAVSEIRLTSRKARGVILCRLDLDEQIVSASPVPKDSFSEDVVEDDLEPA